MEKFSLGSKVKPRMVELKVVGMGVLLMSIFSGLLYAERFGSLVLLWLD